MYAIFVNLSKQYIAEVNKIIKIDNIKKKNINDIIEINTIILMSSNDNNIIIGNPFIKNRKIIAKIISKKKEKKIGILKFKRRKHYKKFKGHRQLYTNIKILKII